jgi:hypothetical protein
MVERHFKWAGEWALHFRGRKILQGQMFPGTTRQLPGPEVALLSLTGGVQSLGRFLRNLLRNQFQLGNLSAILDVLVEQSVPGNSLQMTPALLEVLLSRA